MKHNNEWWFHRGCSSARGLTVAPSRRAVQTHGRVGLDRWYSYSMSYRMVSRWSGSFLCLSRRNRFSQNWDRYSWLQTRQVQQTNSTTTDSEARMRWLSAGVWQPIYLPYFVWRAYLSRCIVAIFIVTIRYQVRPVLFHYQTSFYILRSTLT